jgi:hypothetical protein
MSALHSQTGLRGQDEGIEAVFENRSKVFQLATVFVNRFPGLIDDKFAKLYSNAVLRL